MRPRQTAWAALAGAARLCVHGRRRYRVWWQGDRAWAVRWRAGCLPKVASRRRRRWRRRAWMVLACALVGAWVDPRALPLLLTVLLVGAGTAWVDAPRRREVALRRRGARPGPWVWAIDATSAIRTAEIAAGVEATRDQARRTPSMRIQSPSCSHTSWSNQAW